VLLLCAKLGMGQVATVAIDGTKVAASAPEDGERKKAPARNITDPDSRLMPVRGGGFIQGCNAQNVPSADGLILATRLTNGTTGYAWYHRLRLVPPATPGTTGYAWYQALIADAIAAATMRTPSASRRWPTWPGCGTASARCDARRGGGRPERLVALPNAVVALFEPSHCEWIFRIYR
jgi:hypothetical protein